MSAKAPRTYLSPIPAYHQHHRHNPHIPFGLRPRTFHRTFTSNPPLLASPKPRRAGSTVMKERGDLSSFRTKTLAKNLVDEGVNYPSSIWSRTSWTQAQLLKMGITYSQSLDFVDFMFYGQIHQESPKYRMGFWHTRRAIPYKLSHKTSGRIFCVLGLPLLRELNQGWQNFGVYLLECAVEVGDSLAAMHLCTLENRSARFKGGISQKARELVEEVAYQGEDWRALAVRAEYLMSFKTRPAKLEEALGLAKALVDMTEANPEREDEGPELIPLLEPWRILLNTADLVGDTNAKIKAVQAGATQYNDPEAYLWLAHSKDVKIYSEEWIDFMTKAAMGGRNGACYELGIYWLEKKGWYPCPETPQLSKVSFDAESSIGFDWLEVAAVGRSPELAANLFLGMALVCRENNCSEVGLGYLESGIEIIKGVSGDTAIKEVNRLRKMIDDWSNDWSKTFRHGQTTSRPLSEDFKAANFLRTPSMR